MPLSQGLHLGHYEILAPLGAGGMGEVYRARDARIGREVAIKVLPDAYSRDPDRLRRFESEVRAAGALNHPNILAIFDAGTYDGAPYIVSELLTGQTLRQRLSEGPIPPRKAVEYALAIAQGLAAANDKGIIHRDLKPENLFLTKDGRVKILDFGLAKLDQGEKSEEDATLTMPVTQPGTVLGTMGYMSPEQVRGMPVDHRSDIFVLGAILYEMLTGRRAFHGDTPADTMTAILKEDLPALAGGAAPALAGLDRVIGHCLEKAPEHRFRSAADLAFALESLSWQSGSAPVHAPLPPPRSRKRLAFAALATALVGALSAVAIFSASRPAAPTLVPIRFDLPISGQDIFPTVSPDGRMIAYFLVGAERRGIWLRPLNRTEATPLAGAEDSAYMNPFWSPDSRSLAYFAQFRMMKRPISGGDSELVASVESLVPNTAPGFGAPRAFSSAIADWGSDGSIVFARVGRMYRLASAGGEPRLLYDRETPQVFQGFPRFLTGGRLFLFCMMDATARLGLFLGSVDGRKPERLADIDAPATIGHYQGRDFVVFPRNQVLFAQAFSASGKLEGQPIPLDQTQIPRSRAYWNLSAGGNTIAWLDLVEGQSQLTWFDLGGRKLGAAGAAGAWRNPALSPDGTRIAVRGPDGLWMMEPERGLTTRIVQSAHHPIWLPDGRRLIHSGSSEDRKHIYISNASGAGEPVSVFKTETSNYVQDVTRDGSSVLYIRFGEGPELYAAPIHSGKDAQPVLIKRTLRSRSLWARLSPDGKWLAICSDESGALQIYVQPYQPAGAASSDARLQVSIEGGVDPQWSPDGKQLYFLLPDARKLMAADVKLGPDPQAGKPRVVLEAAFSWSLNDRNSYVISPDGQRILALIQKDQHDTAIQVLVNWFAALQNRRPE